VYYSITDYAFFKGIGISGTDICKFPHSDHNAVVFTAYDKSKGQCKKGTRKEFDEIINHRSGFHVFHEEARPIRYGGSEINIIYYLISIVIILIIFVLYITTKNGRHYSNFDTHNNNMHTIHPIRDKVT
jgi:hypothetical protein